MDKRQRAKYLTGLKKGILAEGVLVVMAVAVLAGQQGRLEERRAANNPVLAIEKDYIKWVDFTVSYEALCSAYDWDVKTHGTEHEVHWVELLAYTAARTGGAGLQDFQTHLCCVFIYKWYDIVKEADFHRHSQHIQR